MCVCVCLCVSVCVCVHPDEKGVYADSAPSASCLFHLRGSASCSTVMLCSSLVFIHQGETLNTAAMGKQVRSDKETLSGIELNEFNQRWVLNLVSQNSNKKNNPVGLNVESEIMLMH